MRTTSKKKQKSKSFFQQEKFTAELSSGQLVVGISILILFGLTCFLLGILLGRSEYTRTAEYASAQQPKALESVGASVDPPEKQSLHLGNVPPTIHRLPAPQPSETLPSAEPDTPSALNNEAPTPTLPVEDIITPLETPTSPTISLPQEPVVSEVAEATITDSTESVITSSDLDISNAPYSVQVGAFSKRTNAESAKKKIESKTSYPVRLIDIPESKVTVVLVGAFQDTKAAETARTLLKEKLGFTDSYIKKNSQ